MSANQPLGNQRWWSWRYLRYLIMGVAIALLGLPLLSSPEAAQADEATAESPQRPPISNPWLRPLQDLTPPDVTQIFNGSDPETARASVNLDGRQLFEVVAPVDDGILSAADRAEAIEQRLRQIIRDIDLSESLEGLDVEYQIDEESNQPVIYVNGEDLMTVTYLDARLNGSNSLTLRASQITDELETALTQYYQDQQPEALWWRIGWTAATLFLAMLINLGIAHLRRKAEHRRQYFKAAQAAHQEAVDTNGQPPHSVNSFRTTLLTRQRISNLGVLKQLLQVVQIAVWAGSVILILGFFPYTRWLQPLLINLLRLPIRFTLIGLVTYGLIRLSSFWIDRLFLAFQTRTTETIERSQRLVLRLSTFSQVIKGIVAFLIGGIAFLVALSLLGVQVAPLLAGAGLLGFAVSFASQSLIKDIINGFLVLVEDQYGVGDVITVRGFSGFVETMNLRITQLRATDGQLITIPNGQIDIVQNLSKEWSRVDLMIPVGLTADIDRALHLVEEIANQMRQDGVWGALILEPPLLLGVDDLNHTGATIRIWVKTQPLKQWDVAREYRRRLKIAFEAAHIPIGVPQQIIHVDAVPLSHSDAAPSPSRHTGDSSASPDARSPAETSP